MQVKDIIEKLDLQVFGGNNEPEKQITGGYVSDLLSDVMGYSNEGNVWVTLQTHKNVMAIASLKELSAVILVKGLKPSEEALEHANEEGIALLGTNKSTFEITGELYKLLK
jgi:predicted transcriptional regulator